MKLGNALFITVDGKLAAVPESENPIFWEKAVERLSLLDFISRLGNKCWGTNKPKNK